MLLPGRVGTGGRLRYLTEEECLDFLKSKHVGRVAYGGDGPVVLPVNYAVHHDTILFQTSPHSSLVQHLRTDLAAFEVDDIDDRTLYGWSVLVRGPAAYVSADDLPVLSERPGPWPVGHQSVHVRITPRSLSGRLVLEPGRTWTETGSVDPVERPTPQG